MTKIKKHHCWITIALFLCVAGACKKPSTNTPIDADLKKYFSYKPGTYWIYRDSLSGEVDSFAVLSNTYSTTSLTYETDDQEIDNITVFQNGIINNSVVCIWKLYKNNIEYVNGDLPNPISYTILFEYPFQAPNQFYTDDIDKYSISVLSLFSIGSSTFSTVAIILHTNDLSNYNDLFYISTDVGIIKMRFNHSTLQKVWELQRYKIVH